jgi:hypothetical protein
MPAVVVQIADAVVATLDAATLSLEFAAERAYVPEYSLDEGFSGLKVTVVPQGLTRTTASRGAGDYDYAIDVAVQKRLGDGLATEAENVEAADPLMEFVEEVADLFVPGRRLADFDEAVIVGVANTPIFDPRHMAEAKVFTSLLTITFRATRPR